MEAAILANRSLPRTTHAVTNRGQLESALARPMHVFGDQLVYPTLIERAAALLHGVASAHAFFDGNKRTAWLCTSMYLEREGSPLQGIPDTDAADFVVNVVLGHIGHEDISVWLLDRT